MPPVPGGVLLAIVRINAGTRPESFLPAAASSAAVQFSWQVPFCGLWPPASPPVSLPCGGCCQLCFVPFPDADLVVTSLINQQIVLECRFCVAALHACRKAAVGCFDVAIAMVNTDDVNSVFDFPFKIYFLRTYLTSPPCALDSSDAR